MARLIQTAQRKLLSSTYSSSCSKTLVHGHQGYNNRNSLTQRRNAISSFFFQATRYTTDKITKSPYEANILRILHKEIEYQSEYAPPHQPVTTFNSFMVQDRPGEQWMTMRGRFDDTEDIKLEVTMFDGYETVPKPGEDSTGEDVRLHSSVLVDISKGDGSDALEFLCSAWPDCLEIQKVYLLGPHTHKMLGRPYLGPDFRYLNHELQKKFREYLEARGVNNELSVFLHEYMMNKDRIELIQWLGKVKSFVEN